LARNYISQHRFKETLNLPNGISHIGEGKKKLHKNFVDVQMELEIIGSG
jgi:hypothetical protein